MAEGLRDDASGLLNEAFFRAALPGRLASARRTLKPLSLVVLAVDDETATTPVAHGLLDTLRESDTACRLDDGRFTLLLEDTAENGAVWTVERLRRLLESQGLDVPLWAGVAAYPAHALEAGELLERAEQALVDASAWDTSRIEVAPSPW
jgi:PleD family two-component response regulator